MDEQRAKDKIILKELEQIISEYNPEKIIIGMPYNENRYCSEKEQKKQEN